MEKKKVMEILNCSVDSNLNFSSDSNSNIITNGTCADGTYSGTDISFYTDGGGQNGCWNYWQGCYYPYVIKESYPVYLQERAKDKGKVSYELIKGLIDKKLIKINTVKEFINLMDFFLKIL